MRDELEEYFRVGAGTSPFAEQQVRWRISCYDSALRYADYIQSNYFPLSSKTVLDVSSAWGGHSVAFATKGCEVVASDLNDHQFEALGRFINKQQLNLRLLLANCEQLPFTNSVFDVVLAFELIEHIPAVDHFASELSRVLKPGGICLLSTPARLRSFFNGEPHYGIKGITILPFAIQKYVASKIFRREYPFPIERQYSHSKQITHVFKKFGLEGHAVLQGTLSSLLKPSPALTKFAQSVYWNFFIFQKEI